MEDRHLNIKKVLITAFILIFSFVIIFFSALLTNNSVSSKKKEKTSNVRTLASSKIDNNSKKITSKSNTKKNKNAENNQNSKEDSEEAQEKSANNDQQQSQDQNENQKNEVEENENQESSQNSLGVLPVPNPNSAEQIKSIYFSDEKQVYLTFDDGPSNNITPQILDILKEEGVPATFFVLGSRAELYPELVKREFDEGHYIANHGYSHKYSQIYASVQSVIDEYNMTEQAIQRALGTADFHSYLFRFPGGSSGGPYNDLKAEAKNTLWANSIASTNWNCLTGDAEALGRTKEELLARLAETANGRGSLIILMHDAADKQPTADALREIIPNYKNQGYVFKNFYEIFKQQ